MTVFTVHVKDTPDKPDLVLVKDGFSWGAALFSSIWALCVGAWELAIALLVVQVAVGGLLPLLNLNAAALGMAQLGMAVIIGLIANEGRRVFLNMRGLTEIGVVTGPDKVEAERRFLDTHPDITAQLLETS